MMAVVSLLVSVLAVCVFTLGTDAQLKNDTLQESNSTVAKPTVNLTSTAKPELPPGGLPEVLVDSVNVVTSAPAVPDAPAAAPAAASPFIPPDPQVAAKQMKEVGGLLQVIDPDSFSTKVLGSRCLGPKDCLAINNTNCINGICDCISGFTASKHSLEKCIKVPTGLGDSCEEEVQCALVVKASECRGGVCSCPPNYVFDQAHCWERQLLGGVCNTSVQCDNVALSICAQGVCTCQPPLIPNPNSNKCLQTAGDTYRAACEEDIQCTDSFGDEAHCSNSQCVCSSNYHFNGSVCVSDKKFGEDCERDADCTVSDVNHAEGSRACVSQVCGCAEGFISLPGEDICMEKSSVEELAVSLTWLACIVIAKYLS